MDAKVKSVLAQYHQRIEKENALMQSLPLEEGMKRRDEFLLPVGEEVGRFLNALINGSQSKSILEVGTSYGYSTLWLAQAARSVGGKVTSLEIDPKKSSYAQQQLTKAGLNTYVDFLIGDALEFIKASSKTYDFVLLDIWKEFYVPCLIALSAKINNRGFIIADNMIHPPNHKFEAKAYRKQVRELAIFDSVLLPLGSGLEVSRMKLV